MNASAANFLSICVNLAWAMLCLSLLLALVRLILGPTVPDRVVALDMIGIVGVGIIAVNSIAEGETVYLMTAIVMALILFLGTVAFASFLHRGGLP